MKLNSQPNFQANYQPDFQQLVAESAVKKSERVYFLPVTSTCVLGCRHCDVLGCLETYDRETPDVMRAIMRALSGRAREVMFAAGVIKHPLRFEFVRVAKEKGLRVSFQLSLGALGQLLRGSDTNEFISFARQVDEIELVYAGGDESGLEFLEQMKGIGPALSFVLLLRSKFSFKELHDRIPVDLRELFRQNVYFLVSPLIANSELTLDRVYRLASQIKRDHPDVVLRALRGRDVWEPAIPRDLELEPLARPVFECRIAGACPQISVIIPSYQSASLVRNVLRHLLQQTLSREEYEIILVDDGSSDSTHETIRAFMAPEAERINFKYLRYERKRPRQPGVADFRAGLSRNLGVKHARGEILSFLDSDIITPPDYLEKLLEELKSADVVQCIRRHLKRNLPSEFMSYESVRRDRDTFVLEPGYWGRFFKTRDWQALPQFWKYTCTYSLTVRKRLFLEVGWIRKTFTYYGFEDTDLGYRLANAGARFHLSHLETYHLSSERERREGFVLSISRHEILAVTAKIFWRNTLDLSIYESFRSFMGERRKTGWFRALFKIGEPQLVQDAKK